MNALIISAVFGVLMMFSSFLLKKTAAVRGLAITGMIILIATAVMDMNGIHFFEVNLRGMLSFDRFAMLFIVIALTCSLLYILFSGRDMERVGRGYADYFALIFFILCGIMLVASFRSLLILFLGVEIISIPLYILTGSDKRNLKSNEASLKYFLMGSFSTGLMLMGLALIYGAGGGSLLIDALELNAKEPGPLMIAGISLLLFSMAFKVSAAPFHFWTPDVYDGAPTVFTSFMATIVKAGFFIAFVRLFGEGFGLLQKEWSVLVALITAATLLIGNITAVFQQSVKRMLAYSSIAQAGFMMLAVYSVHAEAREGLILYAAAYSLATIGIFAVLARVRDQSFEGFNGFAKQDPLLAATITIFLLSLAGIPLTAGFLAKFWMIRATLVQPGNIWLVVFAVLMAAVSVYYYFRLIQAMYFREAAGEVLQYKAGTGFRSLQVAIAAILIILGMFPNLLLYWLYF